MRVLFVYPNAQGYPRVPLGLSASMTILEEDDHKIDLFDTTFLLHDCNTEDDEKQKVGLVKPTDTTKYFKKHSKKDIEELFKQKINKFSPDLIAFSILEDNYHYANELMKVIKSIDNIPIMVGGTTPTVAPQILIKNPNIDWLIQGEGELAMREFCRRFEKGQNVENVPNLVFEKDSRIVTNPIGKFVEMEDLPFHNFDRWDEGHLVKSYDGVVHGAGFLEKSRGCMFKCTYCVNVTYQSLLKESGRYIRSKSVNRLINEAKYQIDKYGFEMFFFCDDNFLTMTKGDLNEFSKSWKEKIDKPFWINTTVESCGHEERIKILKQSGCHGIGLGIETGSEILRSVVLHKFATNETIKRIVNMLNEYGYRSTANIILGFPGETIADIRDTVEFVRDLEVEVWNAKFLSPYYATPIHKITESLGYIDVWKNKPGFNGLAKQIGLGRKEGPAINIPTITRSALMDAYQNFSNYVLGNKPFPSIPESSSAKDNLDQGKIFIMKEFYKHNMLPSKLRRDYASLLN